MCAVLIAVATIYMHHLAAGIGHSATIPTAWRTLFGGRKLFHLSFEPVYIVDVWLTLLVAPMNFRFALKLLL